MTFKTALLCAATVMSLVGCASYKPMPKRGTQEYRETLAVVVQVCMPTTYGSEHLWISRAKRYGTYGEMRSYVSGAVGVEKVGSSSLGQPIFEKFTRTRPDDLIAVIVNVDKTKYVYDLEDKKLSAEDWTIWYPPLSQNFARDMVEYRIANNMDLRVRQPDEQAPKVRYRLVRMKDWKAARLNDNLSGCDL